ncbi:MAG: hypothetical protein DLM67_23525 [Candidatus Nephthysia bennettiae]|uniref:DUF4367 domain-containing protein n=1 Tax=Candidatus Nephthysia bennettiae TaxID=3127016 RepID=A0A934KC74_9BACT|nr:hypothetical protein [Candidatus Dormibacteraeota bacterium]MBJ7612098.1 hypothetical protein [Candidatus Dormibacteraeota bacterium]PZR86712.1 MAG: hypothetical protein DLM67_23525 [Candidatus Dormibacteraeota bacterium]
MADERNLESMLGELSKELEWPATPDLRETVERRISRRRRPGLPILLLAAALATALVAAAAAEAYLGLRGASISRAPSLPSPSATATPSAPAGVARRLELGDRYDSVDQASAAAGFRPLVPAALGPPDAVYYNPSGHVVSLLYRPRAGLPATEDPDVGALVMEAPAALPAPPFVKVVGPGTDVRPVTVNGGPGYWITGAQHAYFFYEGGGGDHFRLAGNVLIWNQGALAIRIESSLPETDVRAAARSVG